MHFFEDIRYRYWYDMEIKSWTTQELDQYGNQLTDECDYHPRKSEMLIMFPDFKFIPEPVDVMHDIELHLLRYYIQQGMRWKIMAFRADDDLVSALNDKEWHMYQDLLESARESL